MTVILLLCITAIVRAVENHRAHLLPQMPPLDASTFSIIEGQDLLADVDHDGHYRYHCSKCHSWVYGDSEQYPGMKFIPCGTLNEAPKKKVDHHVCVDVKSGLD